MIMYCNLEFVANPSSEAEQLGELHVIAKYRQMIMNFLPLVALVPITDDAATPAFCHVFFGDLGHSVVGQGVAVGPHADLCPLCRKLCDGLLGSFKPVVGNVEVLLRGRVAEGPPCYGLRPCEANGHLYLIVFDDEEAHGQLLDRREEFRMSENITESIRPRFWYFTFAACGIKMEVPAFFEIHAQNVLQGFESEFGMDQQGSLLLQVAAASGFMGLFLALRMGSKATGSEALRSRPLLRILLISSGCSSIGACCFCMHWAVYASDGTGLLAMEVAGTGLVALAKALLAILQLMLAKGWALFYSPQQLLQRQAIVSAVLLIVVISILCELHEVLFHDWSARIYMYENWSGFTILVLNCLLFAEAWRSMRDTFVLEGTEEIRRFYVFISFVSILYFLTLPLVCLLASLLSPWVRAKYVDRCEVGCRFLATLILGHLLRPSRMDAMLNARMEDANAR
eukprot:g26052.t1